LGRGSVPQFYGLTLTGSLTLTGLSGVLQATAGAVSGGAAHSALASIGADDHHNQVHDLVGTDHEVSGLTPGYVLKALTDSTFGFAAPNPGFANPMFEVGDMIAGDLDGEAVPLAIGDENDVLTVVSGYPSWAAPAASAANAREIINILLSTYIALDNAAAGYHLLCDGMMDAFESESGVDTTASTYETYSSGDDWYTPAGTVTSLYDSYEDSTNNSSIGDSSGTEYRLAQSFQVEDGISCPKVALEFGANLNSPVGNLTVRIETDNSGVPSGTLVHADATKAIAITPSAWNEFAFPSSISLAADTTYWLVTSVADQSTGQSYNWRIDITGEYADGVLKRSADGGSTWDVFGGDAYDAAFRIYEDVAVDMSLESYGFSAKVANPTIAKLVVLEVNVDTPTLNTDLKGWISRDNGSTFTQVTLSDKGLFSATQNILYGSVDISGAAAGSTLRWRLTSHNSKSFHIKGVGIVWE
jgi:hypothetical protein